MQRDNLTNTTPCCLAYLSGTVKYILPFVLIYWCIVVSAGILKAISIKKMCIVLPHMFKNVRFGMENNAV